MCWPARPLLASEQLFCPFLLPLTGWSEDSAEGRDGVKGSLIPESGGQKALLDYNLLLKIKLFMCVFVCV